jgi:hypothetical protein
MKQRTKSIRDKRSKELMKRHYIDDFHNRKRGCFYHVKIALNKSVNNEFEEGS